MHSNARTLAAAAVVAISAVACGAAATKTSTPTPKPARVVPATPTPAPAPPPLAAPLIVQVENSGAARPQSGLSAADMVYEYNTEGGITRFTAFYFQPPPVQVGPVRSARLVTIKLTQIYDASLVYSGASVFVDQSLTNSGVRHYNETSSQGALFRVNSRAAPHNLYTDGSHAQQLLQRIGPHTVGYQLWGRTPLNALPPGGQVLSKFSVPLSDSEQPTYTYDPATQGYLRVESDTGILSDADSGAAWEPKNILVMPVAVTEGPEVEDVSGAHGLDYALIAAGQGQLLVGGQLYAVTYTQGPYGPPSLKLANGQPAPVGPGQVLIELVPQGKSIQPL